ncbi:MAG: serine/threonine-protein kinase, partial [Kiritimatiellae bacterium]|nr:serine/threonine-protein kinase [Kiritimatiellia bacterium]
MEKSMGSMKTVGSGSRQAAGVGGDLSMGGAPTLRGGSPGRRFRAGEVILGRYRVTGELGQGGMGVVYRCFDETAGIEIALKALPPEVGHNSGEMDEVRENFRLVERLHHPNIAGVKTLEKDPASGDYYLIMECVDGLDLRQWARKRRGEGRPLTADEIVIVAHRIASALDYAHEQRVIHRDIKPANVRVNFEGDVKVLDFGLAAQLHTSLSRVSQAYRGTSGTGPYMAPEQWRGQRQDARADQYALAATVYELFAGAPPFESHDIGVLRAAVLSEPPPLLENAPPHVNAALRRGLAKEPGERFATCGEFVAALGGGGSSKVLKFR